MTCSSCRLNGFCPEHPTGVDVVNNPPHYQANGVQAIDVIEAFGLGFHAGNAIKYILRCGRKDPAKSIEDLRKARWYLDRLIADSEKR